MTGDAPQELLQSVNAIRRMRLRLWYTQVSLRKVLNKLMKRPREVAYRVWRNMPVSKRSAMRLTSLRICRRSFL